MKRTKANPDRPFIQKTIQIYKDQHVRMEEIAKDTGTPVQQQIRESLDTTLTDKK